MKTAKSLSVLIPLLSIFSLPLSGAENSDKPKTKDSLARIAIIRFDNNSGKNNYDWVSKSLPDAIDGSMQLKFEYVRVPPETADTAAARILKSGKYTNKELKAFAVAMDADMVIFGGYEYEQKEDQLKITANIYHRTDNNILLKTVVTSPLDRTVFTRIDEVASRIVDRIYQYALQVEKEEKKTAKLRLLVMVPSWTNESEQQMAETELQALKVQLSRQYNARFLTLKEFYTEYKIGADEQKKVNGYALEEKKDAVLKWLAGHGIKDAFVVLVKADKVQVTPVLAGNVLQPVEYKANADPETRQKAVKELDTKAGLKESLKTDEKVSLTADKPKTEEGWIHSFRLYIGPLIPLNDGKTYFHTGFTVHGSIVLKPLFFGIRPIGGIKFMNLSGRYDDTGYKGGVISAGAFYPILQKGNWMIGPFAEFGLALGALQNSNSNPYKNMFIESGALVDYALTEKISIAGRFSASYLADKTKTFLFVHPMIGASYRW